MTDLIGPASAPNAATTRISEYRSFGSVDTWFKDCSTPASQDGTAFQAGFFNGLLGQLRTLIRGNGQLASGTGPVVPEVNTVDSMLLTSMQLLIARGQPNFAIDTGTADALVAAPATSWPEYVQGARLWLVKSSTSGANVTTTPTVAVSGLAAVTIVKRDGTALAAKDLPAGAAFVVEYFASKFWIVGLAPSDAVAAVSAGKFYNSYTTAGTYSFTVPSGVTKINFRARGAGGGGGGCSYTSGAAPGGSGGSYAEGVITVTPGQVLSLTVGAAGVPGGGAGTAGTAGGFSAIGSLVNAPGGLGGLGSTSGAPLPGGTASPANATGGQINQQGGPGSNGSNPGQYQGGAGGGSYLMSATNQPQIGNGNGQQGLYPGLAGGGGSGGTYQGGYGAPGELYLWN